MIELGFVGNIWVRQHTLEKIGDFHGGHKHKFDHVTLLCQGSVEVEIDGYDPKQFKAPTFIVIRKEHNHKITALEDKILYYCIFAVRDLDGEVVGDIFSKDHDPLSYGSVDNDYWDKVKKLKEI